ncbi:serine protease [Archangium violaceum]|uniref:serine protease n=1 Tax=Archangium violaceum TaxID=83451 RepID=UPI00194DDB66|nr:serine protease [Archangium violaceum]QRN99523.1 serine protease [Archangium violaceum]
MRADIRAAIARIRAGESTGTGTLVADTKGKGDLVLTALHVVAERGQGAPHLRLPVIALEFPNGATVEGQLERFDVEHDWAVLRCSRPPGASPLPLAEVKASGVRFETFGFPEAQPLDGMVVSGEVRNHLARFYGVSALQLFSVEAGASTGMPVRGLSGAPCLIDGAIHGVLRSSLLSDGRNVAGTLYACPTRVIADACRDLLRWPDPCAGLPGVAGEPPKEPFRYLAPFSAEDAVIFAGRCREIGFILERLREPSAPPVLVVHGESGVGKSSLLHAGLLPRLQSPWRYARRTGDLSTTLEQLLEGPLPGAWTAAEADGGPLVVVLDQVEEVWTRPQVGDEFGDFLSLVGPLLSRGPESVRGRLVLSIRKEWFKDVADRLDAWQGLRWEDFAVGRLDRSALIEVVCSGLPSERLGDPYRLRMAEPDLPARVADDLLADPLSPVAPVAQILLTRMWEHAKARPAADGTRVFSRQLYEQIRSEGIHLRDFLDRQLLELRQDVRLGRHEESGLALDLLEWHTTDAGSAATRSSEECRARYGHVPELEPLLERLEGLYLLNRAGAGGRRLAHDTLALHVRSRFARSQAPGQRARRVLENRLPDWVATRTGIDTADLGRVLSGRPGMRGWSAEEQALVASSRCTRFWTRVLGGAAVTLVLLLIGWAWRTQQAQFEAQLRVQAQQRLNHDASLVSAALQTRYAEPTISALFLAEVTDPATTPDFRPLAWDLLHESLARDIVTKRDFPFWYRPTLSSMLGERPFSLDLFSKSRPPRAAPVWVQAACSPPRGYALAFAAAPDDAHAFVFCQTDPGTTAAELIRAWPDGTKTKVAELSDPGEFGQGMVQSGDGQWLLTLEEPGGSTARRLRVFNVRSGQQLMGLSPHVKDARISAEGGRLLTVEQDGRLVHWTLGAPDLRPALVATAAAGEESFRDLHLSTTGNQVAFAAADQAFLWRVSEPGGARALCGGHKADPIVLGFAMRGERIVARCQVREPDGGLNPETLLVAFDSANPSRNAQLFQRREDAQSVMPVMTEHSRHVLLHTAESVAVFDLSVLPEHRGDGPLSDASLPMLGVLQACPGLGGFFNTPLTIDPADEAVWMYCGHQDTLAGREPYAYVWNLRSAPSLELASAAAAGDTVVIAEKGGRIERWNARRPDGAELLSGPNVLPRLLEMDVEGGVMGLVERGDGLQVWQWGASSTTGKHLRDVQMRLEGPSYYSHRDDWRHLPAFSSDGRFLAGCSRTRALLWNLMEPGAPARELALEGQDCIQVRFSHGGGWVVVVAGARGKLPREVFAWSLPDATASLHGVAVSFSRSDSSRAVQNAELTLNWTAPSGAMRNLPAPEPVDGQEVSPETLALSSDGSILAVGYQVSQEHTHWYRVEVWRWNEDRPHVIDNISRINEPLALEFTSDDGFLLVGGDDTQVFDLKARAVLPRVLDGTLLSVQTRAGAPGHFDVVTVRELAPMNSGERLTGHWGLDANRRSAGLQLKLPRLHQIDYVKVHPGPWIVGGTPGETCILPLADAHLAFLKDRIAKASGGCIPPHFRVEYLHESEEAAAHAWSACRRARATGERQD